jgi:hypothetical protein
MEAKPPTGGGRYTVSLYKTKTYKKRDNITFQKIQTTPISAEGAGSVTGLIGWCFGPAMRILGRLIGIIRPMGKVCPDKGYPSICGRHTAHKGIVVFLQSSHDRKRFNSFGVHIRLMAEYLFLEDSHMKETFDEREKKQLEQYLHEILAPMDETVKYEMYRYLREKAREHWEFFQRSLERMTAEQRALFFAKPRAA